MPRKGHLSKREVLADPVYGSTLVTKFINSMMWGGKKSTAENIFYGAMKRMQEKGGDDALKLFKKAVENAKPVLEVKTRRVGGANFLLRSVIIRHLLSDPADGVFAFRKIEVEPPNEIAEDKCGADVEAGERLVEDEDVWVSQEC